MTHDPEMHLLSIQARLIDQLGALCNKAQDFIDGECRYGAVEELIKESRELIAEIDK